MKILALNPPYASAVIREGRCQSPQNMRKNSIPQMTLAYIAGVLERSGHTVKVYDCIASDVGEEQLFSDMEGFQPDIAFINTTTPTISSDLDFTENLKKRHPSVVTAVFGTHVTALHKEVMDANQFLDAVIRNEPEGILANFAGSVSNGRIAAPINGCTVRLNGEVTVCPNNDFEEDLDSFGIPAWKHLPVDQYQHPIFNKPYLMLNTSRGCVHKCIFCVAHQFYGRNVRFRSVESVIEEIKTTMKDFGVRHYWFYADDFTHNPEYVKKLCSAILDEKLDIVWWSNTRVDKFDEEMYTIMKKAGCFMLSIGGESGNVEILKRIKKGTRPDYIENAVKLLRRVGINSLVYFLIGLPGETRETIQETIDFAKKINPDYVEFYPATPYPGTEFFNVAVKESIIVEQDWDNYQCGGNEFVIQIPGVTKDELDGILRLAYRQFYLRPTYAYHLVKRAIHPKEFLRLLQFGSSYFMRFVAMRG